jgi:hypothetical protein
MRSVAQSALLCHTLAECIVGSKQHTAVQFKRWSVSPRARRAAKARGRGHVLHEAAPLTHTTTMRNVLSASLRVDRGPHPGAVGLGRRTHARLTCATHTHDGWQLLQLQHSAHRGAHMLCDAALIGLTTRRRVTAEAAGAPFESMTCLSLAATPTHPHTTCSCTSALRATSNSLRLRPLPLLPGTPLRTSHTWQVAHVQQRALCVPVRRGA